MTLNGVMALILRYFTEFGSLRGAQCIEVVEGVVVKKSSRSLSHLLMSFLSYTRRVRCDDNRTARLPRLCHCRHVDLSDRRLRRDGLLQQRALLQPRHQGMVRGRSDELKEVLRTPSHLTSQ